MADLLALTAQLVDIPSVSHHEKALADHVEAVLGAVPWLEVERVADNVVARTHLGRSSRLVLAGHLDTVPANGNEKARIVGDVCWGLGAADMKAGCAVFLELARTIAEPALDLTYVFYECEEVASRFSGLRTLAGERPDLLEADAAVLGEPTAAAIEAGCQGTLRLELTLAGQRAHTARPWKGRNAIHRLAPVLDHCASYTGRRPVLDGCEFAEAIQAVHVEGGVAGNVVPDEARVVLNHRFAPDRSVEDAVAHVRELLGDAVDEDHGDRVELVDAAQGALPGLTHPLLAHLVTAAKTTPRAKLGWTDVSFFAARGVPATNFGPGDPSLAHAADERVERWELDKVYAALVALVTTVPGLSPVELRADQAQPKRR
ncbi:MAG TPA: succinyl-diaminopimelate desuccinylase [Acidimicrobiales bacterium]|nr:succinyl-diaminopimelate desuccinylase [Acidimicrobiales bacterium]